MRRRARMPGPATQQVDQQSAVSLAVTSWTVDSIGNCRALQVWSNWQIRLASSPALPLLNITTTESTAATDSSNKVAYIPTRYYGSHRRQMTPAVAEVPVLLLLLQPPQHLGYQSIRYQRLSPAPKTRHIAVRASFSSTTAACLYVA